jgi:hypothetical protein
MMMLPVSTSIQQRAHVCCLIIASLRGGLITQAVCRTQAPAR